MSDHITAPLDFNHLVRHWCLNNSAIYKPRTEWKHNFIQKFRLWYITEQWGAVYYRPDPSIMTYSFPALHWTPPTLVAPGSVLVCPATYRTTATAQLIIAVMNNDWTPQLWGEMSHFCGVKPKGDEEEYFRILRNLSQIVPNAIEEFNADTDARAHPRVDVLYIPLHVDQYGETIVCSFDDRDTRLTSYHEWWKSTDIVKSTSLAR